MPDANDPQPPPAAEPKSTRRFWTSRRRRQLLVVGLVVLAAAVVAGFWLLGPYWDASGQFEDAPVRQPSRLYGAAPIVAQGQLVDRQQLRSYLELLGYRPAEGGEELAPGLYRSSEAALVIAQREFPTTAGPGGGATLALRFDGRRIGGLEVNGQAVETAVLDPPLLASFYGDDMKERRPVTVDELPEVLIESVLAAEDAAFFTHPGLSATGILRAAWVNFKGGEVRQGGSTLTQQLVKNLYLTHERTFDRKAREAVLAVLIELRYSKKAILQAYLNEIYLGSSNGVNLIGVGAASRAYFGKPPSQLTLAEAATLAGMIRSPASYSPIEDKQQAWERRNQVIDRLVELEWITPEEGLAVKERPVRPSPEPVVRRRAPYFAEHVAAEVERRFGVSDLDDAGYVILSTLDLTQHNAAQEAISWGLEALETGWEKGNEASGGPLQGALVTVSADTGGILAYVGGRDYQESQFDRVSLAQRQAGSAFKPVVYATAFERQAVSPASLVEDAPLTVRLAGQTWSPDNDDDQFRGWVTARRALESSLNVPTARVALQTGLDPIIQTARDLGVTAPLDPFPALALGAFELTPLELATVYSTFANEGRRPPVHGVDAVFDRLGGRIDGEALPAEQPAISPQSAYLLTSVLQGVLDRGTAAGARRQGLEGPLAGKTGTTNGRRDNWFAGYSPHRATVVWVGYDDNASTRMSGSRAALPIWTRYMIRTKPPGGWSTFEMPSGVTTAVIDPESGELATEYCPQTVTEVFRRGEVPQRECHLHQGWYRDRWGGRWGDERYGDDGYGEGEEERYDRGAEEEDRPNRLRRWLRRLFDDEEEQRRREEERRQGEPPPGEPPPPGVAPDPERPEPPPF